MKLKLKRIKELFVLGIEYVKTEGLSSTIKKTFSFFTRRFAVGYGKLLPSKKALEMRRAKVANGECDSFVKISVCIPIYNTPEKYLTELLQSVVEQIYPNWQLCLADASDEVGEKTVQKVLSNFIDERIVYKKIKNIDISTNSNEAASLANGEYIALCDHDDILAPHALYEMAKAINETKSEFLYSDEALFKKNYKRVMVAHFKPNLDYSYLLSCNYICHLACFKRDVFNEVGGFDPKCSGSQDHDLFLKILEKTKTAYHIDKVLYYWRVHAESTSGGTGAKPYVAAAAKRAIENHLERIGVKASVTDGKFPSTYKVCYEIGDEPLVSIIIPNKDHEEDLQKCINSIYEKTVYKNFEIIIAENNSTGTTIFYYYEELEKKHSNLKIVRYEGDFNYSKINNFATSFAKGEYVLLLNNDVEIITSNWLSEMVAECIQPTVGAVGAMLYYDNDTVQHAGIITGLGGYAGHNQKYAKRGSSGYMFRLAVVGDFSACTGACLLVKKCVFDSVNGLDETLAVAYNDVDLCLRIREKGFRIVFTPYAELYHYESRSRGLDEKDSAKKARFEGEQKILKERYGSLLTSDPFYNKNLTLDAENFAQSAVIDRD